MDSGTELEGGFFAGVDSGTSTTKAVVIDAERTILGSSVRRSGADLLKSAEAALDEALKEAGLQRDSLSDIVATGYGRRSISFAHQTKTRVGPLGPSKPGFRQIQGL